MGRQRQKQVDREFLLDATRLVWRYWAGRLPTGIDRVCLAYAERFGHRSHAVLQRDGLQLVLSPTGSDRLFRLLTRFDRPSRLALIRMLASTLASARRGSPHTGMLYLNVGHTGLNEPSLVNWIERNQLRAIFMIHDLIPITHPEFCRGGETEKHIQRIDTVLRSATGVIGNSQDTLQEFEAFGKSRGSALPQAVAALISGYRPPLDTQPRSHRLPYFVALGTIEGRKNHILLLSVWKQLIRSLGDEAPTLLIIGQRGWRAEEACAILDEPGVLAGHVLELGQCSDADLAGWIRGSRALLMPSFAEGFGLPIIEALQLGTPVIASDLPVYHEIAGRIPTYLDPTDGPSWERAIRDFSGDHPERRRQLDAMKDYRAPDWDDHFAVVEEWLRAL